MVIYRSSGVLNLAQGEIMLLGAYLVYALHVQAGLPFLPAVLVVMAAMAVFGLLIERTILRRVIGRPVFTVVMITLGLAIAIREVSTALWGFEERLIGDPWGGASFSALGLRFNQVSLATILAVGAVLGLFFLLFRFTKIGLAMRATALDPEASLAVGISVTRVFGWSWAIAGATATVAGVFLGAFPATLTPSLSYVALRALPAVLLGGLESPSGAVLGGLMVGTIEVLTKAYQPRYAPWLGNDFDVVAAYAVMIVVLLVRPQGLFGAHEVERL